MRPDYYRYATGPAVEALHDRLQATVGINSDRTKKIKVYPTGPGEGKRMGIKLFAGKLLTGQTMPFQNLQPAEVYADIQQTHPALSRPLTVTAYDVGLHGGQQSFFHMVLHEEDEDVLAMERHYVQTDHERLARTATTWPQQPPIDILVAAITHERNNPHTVAATQSVFREFLPMAFELSPLEQAQATV